MDRRHFLQTSSLAAASAFALNIPSFGTDSDELAYHKIDRVEFSQVQLRWPRHVGKNARRDVHGFGPKIRVCKLVTDKGAEGWGQFEQGNPDFEAIAAGIRGRKLSELVTIGNGIVPDVNRVFDMPLHDLAGIVLNKPVYQLLGRKNPVTPKCYSGMIYFDELEPQNQAKGIDAILEECQWDYDYGYRQLKLKIGRGNMWMPLQEGIKRDVEVTRAVAEHFPDCELLVDGNDGFTVDTFIRYLEGVKGIKLFWVEEPFAEKRDDLVRLKAWMKENGFGKTFLADGEYRPDVDFVKELCREGILDVCLFDIMSYGFTPWIGLMPALKKMNTLASPHAWGSQLKTYYITHLTGAFGNTCTIEGATCYSDEIDFGKYKIENGRFIPSPDPGFGMKLVKK